MAADRRRSWTAPLRAGAGTVRLRTTVAAAVVVGVAMTVGAMMLVMVLRNTLTREVRTAAGLRAAEVAAVLESGATPGALTVGDAEDLLIQVLDQDGEVVASSPNVQGLPPVARLRAGESVQVRVPIDNDDDFLAVATAANAPEGRLTVLVARVMDTVGEAVALPVAAAVVAGDPDVQAHIVAQLE